MAQRVEFQPELGRPWFELLHFPFYMPPAFLWWWFAYDAYAPSIFVEGAYIAASGGIIAAAVAIGMSVWRAREAKNVETYGSARWARPEEVAGAGLLGPDGVVLGQLDRAYLRHDGPEHVLCFAPTRSGKGVGLVVPSLLTWPGSAIVHDIKGENWQLSDIVGGDRPTTLYLVVPPSDINRTKPLIRLILNQIGRRLTEDLQAKNGRRRLLLMLDEFPALGRLDFFESALAFMAGYGIKSFLIAQSLNQIEKAYGQNNSILDNCHVRVSFATNDERTAKRVSDALGTATEVRAMKNYAGSRLSPWLGHLMISRSDTARPLLTPGEVMQLPPTDEIVMVAGTAPIRAKKARYYEDERFQERVLAPPALTKPTSAQSDDWSTRPLPPRPVIAEPRPSSGKEADDDPTESERRHQPELNRAETVEKKGPIDNEFALDPGDGMEDDAVRASRMNRVMQGVARQVSLDPADDMGL